MRKTLAFAALSLVLAGCSDSGGTPEKREPAPPPAPVKITQFYASPSVVARGEPVMLCYGVENAAAVRLEPSGESLKPFYNRCIEVRPQTTVEYTLIATGNSGRRETRSLTVKVGPARARKEESPPMIRAFVASTRETAAGGRVTLCYELRQPEAVRIEPNVGALSQAARKCVNVTPSQTTTYTLTVETPQPERAELTIRVR